MTPAQERRTGSQCVSVSLPELLQLSSYARKLSLSALRIKSAQTGQHQSRLLGRGMEFAESRRYQTGDDIRNIDWRVTARTGKAHTKLFAAEKERHVLLCVDMRSSMFFATKGVFKSVQAAIISGYVAWNTVQTGNRLGGIIFDDDKHFEFRPALGKKGALPFLQKLADSADFNALRKNSPSIPAMDHAIANIKRVSTPGSLVFVISDFRCLSPQAREQLILISKHSDLCLCFVYDPLEAALPKNGYFPVTNAHKELQVNTSAKEGLEKYRMQFIERRKQVISLSNQRHIHFMECSTEDDCFQILRKNFC